MCQSITSEENAAGRIKLNMCVPVSVISPQTRTRPLGWMAYYLLCVSTMARRPGYTGQTSPGTIPVNSQQT